MPRLLAYPVRYVPHAEHTHLAEHAELAAIIGREHPDGTADLMVFVPNKEPHWQDRVPEGQGSHTWHHVHEDLGLEEPAPTAEGAQPPAPNA